MSVNSTNTFLNIEDAHLRLRTGNVYAQGINIGGIEVDVSHGLQSVTDTSNVTSNTVQFSNATTGFVTTANVQIGRDLVVTGNATVSKELTVSSNLNVSDDLVVTNNILASNNLTVTGNLNVTTVMSDSNVVTEYTGPHDRPLRKYPEVALTANSDKGYVASGSTRLDATGNYEYYKAFDNVISTGTTNWISASSTFDGSGDPTGTSNTFPGTSYRGEYCALKLPNAIKLDNFHIFSRGDASSYAYSNPPKDLRIFGSNDGTTWTHMKQFQNLSFTGLGGLRLHVNDSNTYNEYAFFVEKITASSGGATYCAIGELELYGYEEGSGSLDTTLKTVYNVPATTGTQLEVYYDAKDLTTIPSTVTDLSPNTNNATLGGNPQVSNGAFVFDGLGDAVISGATSFSGSPTLSYSVWFKTNSISSGTRSNSIVMIGYADSQKSLGFRIKGTGDTNPGNYRFYVYGGATNESVETDIKAHIGIWTHATIVRDGLNMKLYINGKFADENTNTTTNLALDSGAKVALGNYIDSNGAVATISANDSYDGSIANFRLYSKALNAEQIEELYDFQKDYFLGSKSQVTLYKGHLGVGVTEPSGQLELAGDERIQEYPPGPMTGYETMIPGHGVFCWNTPYYYQGNFETHSGVGMYAKDEGVTGWYGPYNGNSGYTGGNVYNGTDFAATDSSGLGFDDAYGNRYYGAWTTFKLPYKINLKRLRIRQWGTAESINSRCAPEDGVILGSNDGTKWYHVHTFTGLQYGGSAGSYSFSAAGEYVTINCNTDYNQYVLITTRTLHYAFTVIIGELQWFGTPGPTTLDKGSLSLTRSLDVPRVSRYDVYTETPRPEKLVVDFDTTVNSSPTDISGKGNHGTFYDGAYYSAADKAFVFSGNQYIQGDTGLTGNFTHSISMWFNAYNDGQLFWTGVNGSSGDRLNIFFSEDGGLGGNTTTPQIHYTFKGHAHYADVNPNQWYHLVCTYSGTDSSSRKIYLDGVETGADTATDGTGATTHALNIQTSTFYLNKTDYSTGSLGGKISNFKLYNVALEPSEVKKLYNLGRTGRSMVISDTAVGIGKVPEAQLDVRGILKASVGLFPDRPSFMCPVALFGAKSIPTSTTMYDYSTRDGLTLSNRTVSSSAMRWKLGVNGGRHTNTMYPTNNVNLVRVFDDTTSETSGVQVPYEGYYLCHNFIRGPPGGHNMGNSFITYSESQQKYITASINGYMVPWGGSTSGQSSDYTMQFISSVLYLRPNDKVIFSFWNNTTYNGGFEQYVSLVML